MIARSARAVCASALLVCSCSLGTSAPSSKACAAPSPDGASKVDASYSWDAVVKPGSKPPPVSVVTQHNDNARTGVNPAETCLVPSVVPSLVQRASFHVDGLVFAQPLLLAGSRYLLIVATSANQLAAFDLSTLSTTPVWQLGQETFGIPGTVEPGPGPLGILSTPVIDPSTNRLYLVARSCASTTTTSGCPQTVHVIDATSGKHLDSVVAAGAFTDADGGVHPFDPDTQMNRPALLLQGGQLVAAWGVMTALPGKRHEEDVVYHGIVMSFDVANLHAPPLFYVDTPNGCGAGIWQAGGGLAGDGQAVYFESGNLTLGVGVSPTTPLDFPATPRDQENSIVRLQWSGTLPVVGSYFDSRPYHSDGNVFQYTNRYDYDLSSSGAALVPDSNLIVAGSKGGIVYTVDRTTMQQTQTPISAFHRQALPAGQTLYIAANDAGPEMLGSPVVWRRTAGTDDALIYFWPRSEYLTSLRYQHSNNTTSVATTSADTAGPGGGFLSLTWNGATPSSAVLWAAVSLGNGSGTEASFIRAYDPQTLQRLWQGAVPGYAKFGVPTIAAGRVFVPSWSSSGGSNVVVYATPSCGG
jgi:hypothetical protein